MGNERSNRHGGLGQSWTIGIALLMATPFPAPGQATAPGLYRLVEAEKSFARAALDGGIRSAFLEYLANDSTVFVPAPTNGKAFYTKFVDRGRKLIWRPIFATISSGGDLGVTTGPWEVKNSMTDETALDYGQFVSIWKKQSDNSWKVLLDFGISHSKPNPTDEKIELSMPIEQSGQNQTLEAALTRAEEQLDEGLGSDAGQVFLGLAGPHVRILRQSAFPAVGREACSRLLSNNHEKIARRKSGHGSSSSSDLAYAYGSYSARAGNQTENGYYLTIWQIDPDRNWKIIIDLQRKVPASEGKQD